MPANTKSSLSNPTTIETNITPMGKASQLKFKNKPIKPKIRAITVAIIAIIIAPPKLL